MNTPPSASPQSYTSKRLVLLVKIGLAIILVIVIVLGYFLIIMKSNANSITRIEKNTQSTPTWISIENLIDFAMETYTPTTIVTPTASPLPTLGIGSKRIRPKDEMVMLYVPSGEFEMGNQDGYTNEKPPHMVGLDDFWIDQTEVTNAMFQKFVEATSYKTDAQKIGQSYVYQEGKNIITVNKWKLVNGANWLHPEGSDSTIIGLDSYPVVQISWNDANAYCKWANARLPTEAEWEMAARGTDGRIYPWGNLPPKGTLANLADKNLDAVWAKKAINDGFEFASPVGIYPDGVSPFGALDMAGNAAEWVADLYQYDYYWRSPYSNPTGPASGVMRVMRGGQWSFTADGLRSTARVPHSPTYSIDYSGFRCAANPN
jgi:formylglycine-generating enzyme required for sulfatase activity